MEDSLSYLESFMIGYKFYPTNEKIFIPYQLKKIKDKDLPENKIHSVDIYKNHLERIVGMHL